MIDVPLIGLGERRQRKKLKKTIISSRVLEQNERMESSHDKKLPNMPADFALVHGFSATNIGKNRLTVCPRPPESIMFIKHC